MLVELVVAWTRWVIKHAAIVLGTIAALTFVAAYIAMTQFSMNSDTSKLIRQDTEWKRIHDEFNHVFPQYDQNSFVVISGHKPDAISKVTRALAIDLAARSEIFQTVYTPSVNDFVDDHALQYLDLAALNKTVSKLADAQPFLTAIAQDNSLRGVLTLLTDAFNADENLPAGITQITNALTAAIEQALSEDATPISWRDELFGADETQTYYQVILVKSRQDFGQGLPNGIIVNKLRKVIADFEHPYRDTVSIRLTGQVPLEHGEIESALDSAQFAGTIAMLILIAVLVWGVRSLRIIAATYLTMLIGLIWTAAFAMLSVGQFNTISIIFLVMFIGLGVDFAVHLCLKYQESLTILDSKDALIDTGKQLGPTIVLCGVTSAVGFLSFVPTDYIGLAEMGIISGGGMIIAVLISLTVIPAFFTVVKHPQPPVEMPLLKLITGIMQAPRAVAYGTLVFAILLAFSASQATFDYSTLSLKDPDSEAMTTLTELQQQNILTNYSLSYIADNLDDARQTKAALLKLSVVSEVSIPDDYLPSEQEEKQFILEDAGYLLTSVFFPAKNENRFNDTEYQQQLRALDQSIHHRIANLENSSSLAISLRRLSEATRHLSETTAPSRDLLTSLVVPPILSEINWLRKALSPSEVSLLTLPPELSERLITDTGRALVAITPTDSLLPVESMRKFTQDVMNVQPKVTGRPVLDLGIGEIVIHSFSIALVIAVTTIFIILLISLRSLIDSVLVFVPLVMTALLTLTCSVLIDLPLNMANVVVIPLIFGLGVDNGIHIVKRFHQSTHLADLVNSSTPKAIFLSNMTTLGTFCALSFSTHQGIYSIGILLTVALIGLMVLTLVSLPALLATFSHPRGA